MGFKSEIANKFLDLCWNQCALYTISEAYARKDEFVAALGMEELYACTG